MTMGSDTGHAGTANVRLVQSDTANADSAGADTIGILDAVDVPIIVVRRDCTVSRFNRAAADALGLVPADIGRPPCDIPALANVTDLDKLCAQVIADEAPCRRDIQNGDRCFILRLAPYAGSSGEIESVVLTFANGTPSRATIEQAVDEREDTKAILDIAIEPLVVLDSDLRVQMVNQAFCSTFGVSRQHLQGVALRSLGNEDWKTSGLWSSLQAILSDAREFQPLEIERDFATIGRRTVLVNARRLARDGDITILVAFQDITDRKRAEENLRRGEQELRDFLENASVAMHWVGPDGTIVWANRTELELLGYTREEYVGHHIAEFHADPAVVENILRQPTHGETVQEYETRLRCKDGSIRNVLINSNVLWEGDKCIHIRCFARDITERKQAEETRARLAAIVESSDDAIISKDLNGVITSWNRGAERVFGYTAEEAIGRPVSMLIPSDRLDEEPHILERIRRGERIDHYETVRRRKDGTSLHISLTVSPIADAHGRIVGASKTARDITARKRAEQALWDSERRFREIIDALPAAVYTTDALGRLTHFNPAAVEFSGREPELGTDQWCVTWKLYRPDGTPLPHDECPMAIALKERRAVRGEQVVAERPDGKRLWFEPYPTPLFDSAGRLTGGINMLLDISERKQAEQELRRRTEELTAFLKMPPPAFIGSDRTESFSGPTGPN